ncbi:MAG: hypothetical protein OEW37_07905 [Rhodospirillaceae bacterium]|nr:hypothetical protein [Rhodospirillaceae bacterium]
MPDIEVRDCDGKLIHIYEIAISQYENLITTEIVLETAKQNAIQDELVSKNGGGELFFSVVEK